MLVREGEGERVGESRQKVRSECPLPPRAARLSPKHLPASLCVNVNMYECAP